MTFFHKITEYLKPSSRSDGCLSELDALYMETISGLTNDLRTAYCQRLIESTKYNLENTKDNEKRKIWERLLKASEQEICHLSTQ